MAKDKKGRFLRWNLKRILALSTIIEETRRAHSQQPLTSSTAASSSCFWVKKKKKVQSKFPVSRLFNYALVRATITRKICFCWQSPETTRDTSVFLLAIGIAKNLECWHNLACSHLKAWIINITLEAKRKKTCFFTTIIENVNHTVCLEIRFSDSVAYQPQNPVGFRFSKWISRNYFGR